ncbi:transposase, partial [Paracoccus aestuariivivens]|nr:hypothetical protein [Paracoccus aestuariivivens]
MGAGGMSRSQVNLLCPVVEAQVNTFPNRPLKGAWPGATFLKVRAGGRIVSRAVMVAVAVNVVGKREILGVTTAPREARRSGPGSRDDVLADKGVARSCLDRPPDSSPLPADRHEPPRKHWTRISSTNPLKRVSRKIKRRADVTDVRRGNLPLEAFPILLTSR